MVTEIPPSRVCTAGTRTILALSTVNPCIGVVPPTALCRFTTPTIPARSTRSVGTRSSFTVPVMTIDLPVGTAPPPVVSIVTVPGDPRTTGTPLKIVTAPPRVTILPFNVAAPEGERSMAPLPDVSSVPLTVMVPFDVSATLVPILFPANTIALSSVILTAPVELKLSEPKLVKSAGLSPSVIEPALNVAASLTSRLVPAASVTEPPTVIERSAPVFDRLVAPVNSTLSRPAWPLIVREAVKSGSDATVNEPSSPPKFMVKLDVGFAKIVTSKVGTAFWLRSWELPSPATPLSSRIAWSSVPGRLKTRSEMVLPLMSTGSSPV